MSRLQPDRTKRFELPGLRRQIPPMKFAIFAGCALSAFVASAADSSIYHGGWIDLNKNGKRDVYEHPSQPVKRRVADLLKRMTLDEKIGQLWQAPMEKDSDRELADRLRRGEISSFLGGSELIETP